MDGNEQRGLELYRGYCARANSSKLYKAVNMAEVKLVDGIDHWEAHYVGKDGSFVLDIFENVEDAALFAQYMVDEKGFTLADTEYEPELEEYRQKRDNIGRQTHMLRELNRAVPGMWELTKIVRSDAFGTFRYAAGAFEVFLHCQYDGTFCARVTSIGETYIAHSCVSIFGTADGKTAAEAVVGAWAAAAAALDAIGPSFDKDRLEMEQLLKGGGDGSEKC